MFIFRMLDFVFRLSATVMLVLILQISVGGRTLEDYLMGFIQTSDSLAPVRDMAYSSVRRVNPNVQIKEVEKRVPASSPSATPPSKQKLLNLKTDLVGDILNTFFSRYKGMITNTSKSTQIVEGYHKVLQKELDKVSDVQENPAPVKEEP